jgi:hypothetical protein
VLVATLVGLPTTHFSNLNVLAIATSSALMSVILIADVLWVGVFNGVVPQEGQEGALGRHAPRHELALVLL